MTDEIQGLVSLKSNLVSKEVTVAIHTMELLIDVASNLLQDTELLEKVLPGLRVVLNEEKAKSI